MLQIKPNCECCDTDLAPDSTQAMICSFECTFCASCVEQILDNVCPNCGGGFVARPIRPHNEWRAGVSLTQRPPSSERVHTPYSEQELRAFAAKVRHIEPAQR